MKDEKKKIRIYLLFILILLFIFFIPLFLKIERVFRDDGAYQAYLKLVAVARYVKNGEIPLWNPLTFCGAKPFYTMYEGPIYNFLLYPFFLLANLNDLDQSYFVLMILPFVFAVILSAIGAYLFSFYILKLSLFSSFFISIFYALSPSMMISIISLHDTFAFCTIPWILFFSIAFIENKRNINWFLLIITLVILSISNDINYVIRIYFFAFLFSICYYLFKVKENKENLKFLFLLILAFILSIGICSVMWFGIFEGIDWINYTGKISYKEIANERMNFGNIITIFHPYFNGIIYGEKAWGEARRIGNSNYIYAGGMFVSFFIFIAIYSIFKTKERKFYSIFFFVTLIITILVMLSDNTPFLRILAFLLPWFFKIPYPHYYYFLEHLSIIILAGIGIHIFLKKEISIEEIKKFIFPVYLIFLFTFSLLAFLEPTFKDNKILLSIEELVYHSNVIWFISEAVTYLIISILIIALFLFIKKGVYSKILVFFPLIEIILLGYIIFYRGAISTTREGEAGQNDICFEKRFKGPTDHLYYNYFTELEKELNDNRFTGSITYIDNFAWLKYKYSLFGYDSKPVNPLFYDVMSLFMEGYPYQMIPKFYPKNFLKNMNVEYIVFKKFGNTKVEEKKEVLNGIEIDVIKIEDEIYSEDKNEQKILRLEKPLPYLYTQSNVFCASLEEQKIKLLADDLQKGCYIIEDDTNKIGKIETIPFDKLQEENKILEVKRKANSLLVKIEVKRESLLIRNEVYHKGWKVWVNRRERPLLRVNYLQQGVWLKEGINTVMFKFFPENLEIGLLLSIISLCLSLHIFFILKKRNKK